MQHTYKNLLPDTFKVCTRAFLYSLLFSFMINLLTLAMPIYTLQILDRVISTGSKETLVMLTVIVVGTFIVLGFITTARSYIFLNISSYFDRVLSPALLRASITGSAQNKISSASQYLRDLGVIKAFFTKQGLGALFDIPWTPIYFFAIFYIHPYNAGIALIGAIALFGFALLNELITADPLKNANDNFVKSMIEVDSAARNADVVEAMGMKSIIVKNWEKINHVFMDFSQKASGRAICVSSCTQIIRLLTQVSMLGVGAYLVLENLMSPGGIVATSILAGKFLAPFNVAITAWQNFVNARLSYDRVNKTLNNAQTRSQHLQLPEPRGNIEIEKLFYQPEGSSKPVIKGISCAIHSGESIGIIGKSGSGKTTLSKLIAGVYKPSAGAVRLDSIDVFEWGRDYIKNYVGYLPQSVELFNGTVRDNIARMDHEAKETDIFQASKIAGAHEVILHLANGYETQVGREGFTLSAGMRQRVGLARAFYASPKVIIMDEPDSNLDSEGDIALLRAIRYAKKKGITVFIISHRPAILSAVDKIMVMSEGKIAVFDRKEKVLGQFSERLGA